MYKSPGEIVKVEVQNFKDTSITLTQNVAFSQYYIIQRINKYLMNRFWDCPDPTALFWNLSTQRIPLYAKSIDMDTKNFYVSGVGETNWFQAWILNVRFKQWARESRLALTLDDVSTSIARYGSTVWKRYDRDGEVMIEECDLRNLYFDPTVKNIIDTPVVELHYMTETEIRSLWGDEKAKEVVDRAMEARDGEGNEAESEDAKYEIWERWGERENRNGKVKYYHDIGVGCGELEVELSSDEINIKENGKPKAFPYYDFHGERVSGRWMGLGVVERLFPLQEQINTLVNQNQEANEIASLLLFRTADPDTTGNILQSVETGQIINSQDMQQLPVDNRFIGTFINQLQLIEDKADKLCFLNESITGETPPSGMPFRSLAVSTRAALSTFRYIKTSIGEKMGYILQEDVMPNLVKQFNREDVIEIAEDENDIRLFDEMVIKKAKEQFQYDLAKEGFVVFEEDLIAFEEAKREELTTTRRVEKIGKKFFDFEYGIHMNPTGESVDKNAQNAAIDGAIEMMLAAPSVVDTPLFKQKLSNNGIPPFRLTPREQQQLQQTAQGQKIPEAEGRDKLMELAEVQ